MQQSTQPSATSTARPRDPGIDATRGIAMLAVVVFHVLRGFVASGLLAQGTMLKWADTVAYGFHVQTFLLIAAYLSFPRAGDWRFLAGREISLYYCYLLWSLVSWALATIMAGSVNHPVSYTDLLTLPFHPIQQFWFILALMMGTAALGLLRTPVLLIGGIVLIGLLYVFGDALPILNGYRPSILFMLIGGLLRALDVRPKANIAIALACALALGVGAWEAMANGNPMEHPYWLPINLAGCYAAFAFGAYAARLPFVGPALIYCGQHSLTIFLLHVIAGAAARVVVDRLVPTLDTGVMMMLVLIASMVGPLMAEWIAERTGTATLLGFRPLPLWRSRTAAVPVAS